MKIGTRMFILLLAIALLALALGEYHAFPTSLNVAVLMLLTIVAAHFLSRTITKPLQDLIQEANQLSQRDYENLAHLECSTALSDRTLLRQDEIGELVRALQRREVEFERSMTSLKQTTAAKERMESELQIGREIQMQMLTLNASSFPKHKALEISATLKPAREVSGDFYDFYFRCENLSYLFEESRFCFCVGDASGKGVPAALFMAVIKTLIKSQSYIDLSPANILTHVNEVVSADNPSCMFVTLFFGVLNLIDGELVYTNAGHTPPYIRRRNGSLEQVNQGHDPALGVLEGLTYKEYKIVLEAGDILITYTDGVTEAMDLEQNLFSEQRFFDLLMYEKYHSAEEVIRLVTTAISAFQGDAEQADDLTIFALQFLGQPSPAGEALELTINNEALFSLKEQWK
jgi:phosphoserine phosphatase RsbU/P